MQPEPWEASPTPPERPRFRPPVGIPAREERGWKGVVVSILLHALIIFLLTSPFTVPAALERIEQGTGGPGPAGGGGGGTGGTGGLTVQERLRYVQIAPPPPAATPTPQAVPPVVPPPVEQKKPEEPKPTPPVTPPTTQAPPAPASEATAPTPGSGGGTGNDGTSGSGPGTGGGTGSGVGTGIGSGVGPGTGGGTTDKYSPTPKEVFIPPQPVPSSVRGSEIVAQFDVDETGRVLKCEFTPTRDRGYNKKLKETLCATSFRPATTREGRAIRAVAQLSYTIY